MVDKELQEKAERYCELLAVYDGWLQILETMTKKIVETKKELLFLEGELEKSGAIIKDVEIEK